MITYEEARAELAKLIEEPEPAAIEHSLTNLTEALVMAATYDAPEASAIGSWGRLSDSLGGGLRPHEFTVLCGPTGAGKTTLLANIAAQLIANFTPIFVASVEVGIVDFMRKVISVVTGEAISDGAKPELEALMKNMGKPFLTKNTVFTNYDSRVPHIQLLCDLLYAHRNMGTKVALIDNLNFLMEVTRSQDQNMSMDKAIHDFVVFCKKVPMHVIMVMHPRKTENGRIDSEFDIKGSSTAVQEASNVLLFNRLGDTANAPLGMLPQYCREIKFAKVRRNGRCVGSKLVLAQVGKTEQYKEGRIV